jgi:hypothetical protein
MATQTAFSQAASDQVTEAFFNGIGDATKAIQQMEKVVRVDRDDVASLKKAAMQGITTVQAWDGVSDPTGGTLASVSSSYQQSVNYSMFMLNVRLPSHDVMDIPNLVSESARKLGFAVSNSVVGQGWGQVVKAWTHDGADGKPPIDAAHPISGGTFDNKETTTLDAAALADALTRLRRFKDLEGETYDTALGEIALVVPPELEKTALELVAPAFSGSDLSANFFAAYNIQVVSSPYLTDQNDWCLIPVNSTPIRLWLRESPIVTQYTDPATNTLNLRVQCAMASYFMPPGYQNIVGNTPA